MPKSGGDARPLAGVGVLITRPAAQAANLIRRIEEAGGIPHSLPTIEIAPLDDFTALDRLLDQLPTFDMAVFVSINAVEHTFARLQARAIEWPKALAVACVGRASADALARLGVREVIAPATRFDSESLLARPELQAMRGKRVMVFRGQGGRALLGDTLRARGADLVYAECYRRLATRADVGPIEEVGKAGRIHVISITSSEGLQNLCDALSGDWLLRTPLVVLSDAQADLGRRLGFTTDVLVAPTASDEAILETIKTWRLQRFSL